MKAFPTLFLFFSPAGVFREARHAGAVGCVDGVQDLQLGPLAEETSVRADAVPSIVLQVLRRSGENKPSYDTVFVFICFFSPVLRSS